MACHKPYKNIEDCVVKSLHKNRKGLVTKHKSEIEKSNVNVTLSNAEEEILKDKNNEEENIREEDENGFKQYKI